MYSLQAKVVKSQSFVVTLRWNFTINSLPGFKVRCPVPIVDCIDPNTAGVCPVI